jgi:methionyl-tRNA formyltransferase
MKVIFAGASQFSLPALKELASSKHKICAVYTKPDQPAGRGLKLTPTPVKSLALSHNLPIFQPISFKNIETQKELSSLNADIFIDVAYGLLLPEAVLNIPKYGCVNIHPSLLPRFRGAAPIQRAILSGDTVTGVTIMRIDAGLDTGDIYKQELLPIDKSDTGETLSEKAALMGAKLLIEVLDKIENGFATATPQKADQEIVYANKLSKEEGKIDWYKGAAEIERMVRAFIPWPIAYTLLDNNYIRIWEATVKNDSPQIPPGTIISADKNGINIATGNGILCLLKIQLPGGKPLAVQDILNAHKELFAVGKKLG